MNILQRRRRIAGMLLGIGLAVTLPVLADVEPPAQARVDVTYAHPEKFTENRGPGRHHYDDAYLKMLKEYLVEQATDILKPGQRLDITITDVDLAGGYEPWQGPQWGDVRFMRDVYPPRIDLTFKLLDSQGDVLRQGTRELRNLGYLHGAPGLTSRTDPLRYDKALLDDWLRGGPQDL